MMILSLLLGVFLAPDRPVAAALPTRDSLRAEAALLAKPYTSEDGAPLEVIFTESRAALRTVAAEFEDEDNGVSLDYSMLLFGATSDADLDPALQVRIKAATLAALERAEALGIFEQLERVRLPVRQADDPFEKRGSRSERPVRYSRTSDARTLATIIAAHNATALRDGDQPAFVRGSECLHRLASTTSVGLGHLAHLTSGSVEQLMLAQIRHALAAGLLDEPTLAALAPLVVRPAPTPLSYALKGEMLIALASTIEMAEAVADEMNKEAADADGDAPDDADPDAAPPKPHARLDPALPLMPDGPTLEPQIALTRRAFGEWAALADLSPGQRADRLAKNPELWSAVGKNQLLDALKPSERIFAVADTMNAYRVGTGALIALERFRLARGRYPESLDLLVPDFLPVAPRDPYTGDTLGYIPPSGMTKDAPHPGDRAFVLYAAGSDLKDDGGVVDFSTRYNPDRTKSGGQDMPLNVETGDAPDPR